MLQGRRPELAGDLSGSVEEGTTQPGQGAGEFDAVRWAVWRCWEATWLLDGELRLLLESPAPGKKEIPVASCGRRRQREALGEGREARGEREEAGGEVSHLFHALEKATHLGGFRPAGKRL